MQQVTLLGIGMGNSATMTAAGQEALSQAELLIGARRMTDAGQTSASCCCEMSMQVRK